MLESKIEEKLVSRVREVNGLCLKLNSQSANGIPDRLVLLPKGRTYFIELKKPGKDLRALQRYWARRLSLMEFEVFKIDSLEEVDDFMERIGGD